MATQSVFSAPLLESDGQVAREKKYTIGVGLIPALKERGPFALIFLLGLGVGLLLNGRVERQGLRATSDTPVETWAYAPTFYSISPPPKTVPSEYMARPKLNNSCLIPNLVFPEGPQTFDACAFVIKSTDEVWNLRDDVDAAIEKYFHEGYYNAGSWGKHGVGKEALRKAVFAEMRAFPDIQIHITDCVCKGNDVNGYKCVMPDVLTGTNTGPSAWGPATGKYARWTGMVESLVKKNPKTGQWQYYAEWGVHDEWSLIQQLGLDFARVPHPVSNNEPVHNCAPLFAFQSQDGEPVLNQQDLAAQRLAERANKNGQL